MPFDAPRELQAIGMGPYIVHYLEGAQELVIQLPRGSFSTEVSTGEPDLVPWEVTGGRQARGVGIFCLAALGQAKLRLQGGVQFGELVGKVLCLRLWAGLAQWGQGVYKTGVPPIVCHEW